MQLFQNNFHSRNPEGNKEKRLLTREHALFESRVRQNSFPGSMVMVMTR